MDWLPLSSLGVGALVAAGQVSSSEDMAGCSATGRAFAVILSVKQKSVSLVYDIEVEDDHSYLACGVFNHNSDPNGQNIPKRGRTPRMKELVAAYRRCFVARPGFKLAELDLSQAELRIAAWMSGDPTMLRVYREGGDIHAMTAAREKGMSLPEFMALPKDERSISRYGAKAINFGYLYGMWWKGFKVYAKTDYGLDLTDEQAQQSREQFFALYSRLEPWHNAVKAFAQEHGYVRGLHGALHRLPAIYSDDEGVRGGAGRNAINSPVQRFASDIALMGMTKFGEGCPWEDQRPIGFIHDSVIIEARESQIEEAVKAGLHYMQNPPLLEWFGITSPIPILAEAKVGDNLQDMEDVAWGPELPSWHI